MATEGFRALIERAKELIWNEGELEAVDRYYSSAYVNHDPNRPDVQTREQFRSWVKEARTAFPDFRVRVVDSISEGEEIVARWEAEGTHTGPLMGIAPTNKHVKFTGATIYRFRDGMIVEAWWNRDELGLMQQLGVLPQLEHA